MNEATQNLKRRWPTVLTALVLTLAAVVILIPRFFRAKIPRYRNTCMHNLCVIDGAKEQLVLQRSAKRGDTVKTNDIWAYFSDQSEILKCPNGGSYSIGRIGENPICSLHGDLLGPPLTNSMQHMPSSGFEDIR
jgi:hypothetical protein